MINTMRLLTFFLMLACLVSCDNTLEKDLAYNHACDEAKLWTTELQKITPLEGKTLKTEFRLDPKMAEKGQFSYRFDKNHVLTLTASDAVGVMDALYTFCETLGTTFDITGVTLPTSVDWDKVVGTDSLITPRVRWRGIRQHVNFSMDISSYPIDQVKEYLQNMVRLRMNKLVIHSYPFQWYAEDIVDGKMNYAGSFFYGNTHRCDKWDFLQELCKPYNDSIFCIPDAEPVFDDVQKRSEAAIAWMKDVIRTAKEMGLRVQFSCEHRRFNVDQTKKLAYILTNDYPLIDDLEFITEEMGGWNDDVPYATQQIDTAAAAIKALEADPAFQGRVKSLKLGIYCVLHHRIGDLFKHAREVLPDHFITVLSQYASIGVAKAYPYFITNAEDLKWTELYSWVEFDGQMYIQQNHVDGIERLLKEMDETAPGVQHTGLLFNHWRTAENRTSFRYAAEATLKETPKECFYNNYASRLGITNQDTFREAMLAMEDVHGFNVDHLGNIGFAAVDFWQRESMHTCYKEDEVLQSASMYLKAGELLTQLYESTQTKDGKEYLELLGNRVLCSKLYLDVIQGGLALGSIPREADGSISAANQKKVNDICERAIAGYERCLHIYAQILPDRGSLGTIVSIWNGPVFGMINLNHTLGGAPLDAPSREVPLDAPPLPTFSDGSAR